VLEDQATFVCRQIRQCCSPRTTACIRSGYYHWVGYLSSIEKEEKKKGKKHEHIATISSCLQSYI